MVSRIYNMPRVGLHPLKNKTQLFKEPTVQDITVTTIIHIPILDGYWAESLEVLKLFFDSLLKNTKLKFDLMVFDNDSCLEVSNYLLDLKQKNLIQYLIFCSENMRKLGALDFLFRLAPGKIIAYADSDVYFLPGWLEESIEILKVFPQTGMISSIPTIDKQNVYLNSTLKGIKENPKIKIEYGQNLIPEMYVRAHRLSLGKSKENYTSETRNDVRISLDKTCAFLSAQDFQFITTREVINKVLPLKIDEENEEYDKIYSPVFENKIDNAGYWRLSTCKYLIHHMGNRLPDLMTELADIYPRGQLPVHVEQKMHRKLSFGLFQKRIVRRLLKKLHTWSYRILFENSK